MISRSPIVFLASLWLQCSMALRGISKEPTISCASAPKYAIALFGGVSRLAHDAHGLGSNAFSEGEPVNISIVGNAIGRHIIEPNGGKEDVLVFIHSWSYDLKEKMYEIYAPRLAKYEKETDYEDQLFAKVHKDTSHAGHYCRYCGAAASLSMQKSLELVTEYEKQCLHKFERILLYRPDVMLWGHNMLLGEYNGSHVTCNHHDNKGTGDFHWVFNSEQARQFRPFDSITTSHLPYFGWIRDYISKSIPPYQRPRVDSFVPCHSQAVLRKIKGCESKGFKREDLAYLGFTEQEATKYGW